MARLREGYMVIAHGGGAWENFNDQAAALAGVCSAKGIPCWYDAWGRDWPHDWQTWHAQIKKYLSQFSKGVLSPRGPQKLIGPARKI